MREDNSDNKNKNPEKNSDETQNNINNTKSGTEFSRSNGQRRAVRRDTLEFEPVSGRASVSDKSDKKETKAEPYKRTVSYKNYKNAESRKTGAVLSFINKSDFLKSSLFKYIITVTAIVACFVIITGIVVLFFHGQKSTEDGSGSPTGATASESAAPTGTPATDAAAETAAPTGGSIAALNIPRKTNILILGVDEDGYLADVDIVASFDSVTGTVNFLSVPRDTYVQLSPADTSKLRSKNINVPADGVMKLNELHSYAGATDGPAYSEKYIGEALGTSIDYYVRIDLAGFRYIIDTVGGIYMNVRPQGYQYADPYQNPPLVIDVPGGYQLLDGKLAEGVVRYRDDYADGDLDRISIQQQFLTAFFDQVLNKESIMNNLSSYFVTLRDYVQTDFGFDRLLLYLSSITSIKPENVHFYTVPGDSAGDYYMINPAKTFDLVNEIINNEDTSAPAETQTPEPAQTPAPTPNVTDVKKMRIQILNGGYVDNKAGDVKNELTDAGYTVTSLGNYKGTKHEETRIMLRYDADVSELTKFFKDALVETDDTISDSYDIVIIIGTGE